MDLRSLRPHFDDLWRWAVGKREVGLNTKVGIDFRAEWSHEFERLMRNRLLVGAYRYGPIGSSGKPQYDRLDRIIKAAIAYKKTGNLEHLVDIANMALLEFVEGRHPNRHFHAEDDTMHTEVL